MISKSVMIDQYGGVDQYGRVYTFDINEAKKYRLQDPTPINFIKGKQKENAIINWLRVDLYAKTKEEWKWKYYIPSQINKKNHRRSTKRDMSWVQLYDYQEKVVSECLFLYDKGEKMCLINAPTGAWKTFIIAWILSKLQTKAIIVAPNTVLVKQLHKDYKNICDCQIQKWWKEILDNDILIMTSTTFNQIYQKINGEYGTLIIDESHRLPAKRIEQIVLWKGDFVVWLTATPVRNNMNEKWFEKFFGNYVETEITKRLEKKVLPAIIYTIEYERDYTMREMIEASKWLAPDSPIIFQNLIANDRQKDIFIEKLLKRLYQKGIKDILVFTDRIDHCVRLTSHLKKSFDYVYEFRWETDKDTIIQSFDKTWGIIVWLKSCCWEWFNIQKLQAGILAMSTSSEGRLVQMVWRSRREYWDKKYGFFFDIVDNISVKTNNILKNNKKKLWYYNRKKTYKKYNFICKKMTCF